MNGLYWLLTADEWLMEYLQMAKRKWEKTGEHFSSKIAIAMQIWRQL